MENVPCSVRRGVNFALRFLRMLACVRVRDRVRGVRGNHMQSFVFYFFLLDRNFNNRFATLIFYFLSSYCSILYFNIGS